MTSSVISSGLTKISPEPQKSLYNVSVSVSETASLLVYGENRRQDCIHSVSKLEA